MSVGIEVNETNNESSTSTEQESDQISRTIVVYDRWFYVQIL